MKTCVFVNKVPEGCPHNPSMAHEVYELTGANLVPQAEELIIRGESEWRSMMRAKGTARDLTGNLDEWPDVYYVTRCDMCDAKKIRDWQNAHWDRSPYERQARFVNALAALECERRLSEQDVAAVLSLVGSCYLTRYDFKLLDEKPGNYESKLGEWHWKLRQVRNSHNTLFDILRDNEALGYADEYAVPEISLVVFNR